MVCINCKKTVNANADFCPYCKCRLKAPDRKQASSRPVKPPSASGNPTRKKAPSKSGNPVGRPQNPSSVPKQPQKPSANASKNSPSKPPVKQAPKPAPPPAKTHKKATKELGVLNSFMAYFILPAFIIFDIVVIFSILNSIATSEHTTSGIFTVCAQTAHLICAVAASSGLKTKSFSSLVFLVLCFVVTALQTAISFLIFSNAFDKLSLFLMLVTAAISIILFMIFAPYYLRHKKEFIKNDIIT